MAFVQTVLSDYKTDGSTCKIICSPNSSILKAENSVLDAHVRQS